MGRIETETSRGVTHTYHYDLTGNRILAELGTGRKIQTVPDALNRPEMILETEGNLEAMSVDARATAYGYDLAGRAVILTTANGQVTENVYDELGRVTNRTLFKRMSDRSDAGVLAEFGWAYNEVGNVTAQHETWPGSAERDPQVRVTAMTYDLSNRLKTETVSQAVTGVVTTTYHYDAANNRKSKTVTGGAEPGHWTYDYNPANQLTAWYTHDSSVVKPEKRMALTYDANGNRTSQQRAALIVDNDAHAGLISQGIQYQAVEAGPDGEDLTISVEPGESGAGLGVSVVNNKHVKVKLAMEEAQADVLENQGITYATLTPHEPGRVVSLTLLDEGPLQSESVTVSGNDVVVRLGTDGGAPASATNQGMTFTAQEFVPVETANSLSVRFEEGLPGQPASTELVGNTAVVKLAMDQGLPHTLLNQGVTYSTKAPHYADKEEVSIALTAAAGPGQAATVDVEGDEITVNLGTTSGDAASVTDQGLIYTAVTPGPGGNSLDIKLQKALDGAPLSASLNGNVVTVNLASNSGKATLEQPGITYEAVEPGAGGNDILIVYDDFTDDLYADVEVQGSTITVYPATVRIPATATLYPELSGGLVMTTTRVEEDDVPTEIQIDQSGDANSPLDIYSDGALIIVTLASGGAEQPITTLAQLATALQSYGITIVSGGNNNTIIGGGGGTVFEGGGYEIIATGDEVADLIRNDPAASALVTVVGSNSTVVTVGGSYLTGGQEPSLISTKADVLSLLNATPAISAVVSVTGDSGTPGSQILDISDLSLSGGGLNAQITTTAAQLVTLLNGAQSLVTATGSGSSALSPLSMTALTGARDPVPSSTRTQVMDLMQNLPGMPDVIEVTGDESTDIVEPASFDLSGGGVGYAIYTRVNGLVELLEGNSLITTTGEGSALLSAMPRTVLTGGAPDILSTAEDVADLLAATTAVTALMAVSLVGDGEALVTPQAAQALSGVTSPGTVDVTQSFTWNSENRLATATDASGRSHGYNYDYRARRVATRTTTGGVTTHTAILFNGGLSTAEYESSSLQTTIASPGAGAVHYVRGPDMGGGVGGLLYSLRTDGASRKVRYNLSNGRGDIVAQSDANASLTWTASYEAYGKRTVETGTNQDKQRANSKDEDPTGLLNEGFRYRDIETGAWLSRDPAGFVDGPNLYAYVKQNPWTAWDPDGLLSEKQREGVNKTNAEASAIINKLDPKGRPVTPNDVKTDGMRKDMFGNGTGWNPMSNHGKLRRQYPGENDDDIALVESARRNAVRAQVLLAEHGMLDKRDVTKLQLRGMGVLLESTIEMGLTLAPYGRLISALKPAAAITQQAASNAAVRVGEAAGSRNVAGYEMAGSSMVEGGIYKVNIWGLYAPKTNSQGLAALAKTLQGEAAAAGASRIRITGSHVINEQLLNPAVLQRAARMNGFNTRVVDGRIILTAPVSQ